MLPLPRHRYAPLCKNMDDAPQYVAILPRNTFFRLFFLMFGFRSHLYLATSSSCILRQLPSLWRRECASSLKELVACHPFALTTP